MSQTSFKGWRPPYKKHLDHEGSEGGSEAFEDHTLSFIKNSALRFLQIVYMQREEGDMKYVHDDEEATEIKIADQNAFQLESSETKPAIIGVRGSVQWQNIGMNSGLQEQERRTGTNTYTDMINGSIALSCLSRNGLEAEKIAAEVFCLFKFFRSTLQKFGFFTVRSMSVGPEQIIDAQGEAKLSLVSVLMSCQVQDRWVLEPESASQLRKVVLEGLTTFRGEDPGDGELIFKKEITNDD